MASTNKIFSYFGFILFFIIDILLGAIFISMRDDPNSILAFERSLTVEILAKIILLVIVLLTIQIVLAFYYSMRSISGEQKFEIYPNLSNDERLNWGKFQPTEVQELLLSVAEQAGVTIKRAYVSTEIIPRIFSYNFGKKPVIILNANLLQICSSEELKAAIAVELGYTKNSFSSIITYLNYSINYFLIPLYVIPFYFLFHGIILTWFDNGEYQFTPQRVITQLFFIIGLIIVSFILWNIQQIFSKLANRNVQYMADKRATKIVGKRNIINMMIKLGQRTEALDLLLEEIKWLESLQVGKIYPFDEKRLIEILPLFPSDELSEEVAQRIAPNIFIKSRLIGLQQTYGLEIPEIDEKIEEAAVKLRQKRLNFLKEEREKAKEAGIQTRDPREETIDWRKADVDGNLELDPDEIQDFIQLLKANKKKLLFENEFSGNLLFKGNLPINKRILAIYNTNNNM